MILDQTYPRVDWIARSREKVCIIKYESLLKFMQKERQVMNYYHLSRWPNELCPFIL